MSLEEVTERAGIWRGARAWSMERWIRGGRCDDSSTRPAAGSWLLGVQAGPGREGWAARVGGLQGLVVAPPPTSHDSHHIRRTLLQVQNLHIMLWLCTAVLHLSTLSCAARPCQEARMISKNFWAWRLPWRRSSRHGVALKGAASFSRGAIKHKQKPAPIFVLVD
jgi:hypothetical protein